VLANRQQRLSARSETYRKSVITVALSAQGMPLIFDGVETDVWVTTSSAAGLKTGNIITTSLSFDASPISKSHEALDAANEPWKFGISRYQRYSELMNDRKPPKSAGIQVTALHPSKMTMPGHSGISRGKKMLAMWAN